MLIAKVYETTFDEIDEVECRIKSAFLIYQMALILLYLWVE